MNVDRTREKITNVSVVDVSALVDNVSRVDIMSPTTQINTNKVIIPGEAVQNVPTNNVANDRVPDDPVVCLYVPS